MRTQNPNTFLPPLILTTISLFTILSSSSAKNHHQFLPCLTKNTSFSHHQIYTPNSPSYKSILDAYIQNLRLIYPTPNPLYIISPNDESQVGAIIHCCKSHNLQLRIRSGGHDFEGLSSVSSSPYVILDLFNLRAVTVDLESATAWVQSGATLGEVYYYVAQKSRKFGFPAGYWSTVGVGGHLSGGGYGPLIRKYGLASDNIVDARFMDVNGRVLEKESMGEDLFWAIRGGGGGNFGVVLAWKIKLVPVPEIVTVCQVERHLDTNATQLLRHWQYVAPKMPKELLIEVHIKSVNTIGTNSKNTRTISSRFDPIFLGRLDDGLLPLMQEKFPDLGLKNEDCKEKSWIEAVVEQAEFPSGTPPEILLNRTAPLRSYAKQKADYVQQPIPKEGLEGLWEIFHQMDAGSANMVWTPYGGKMSEFSESQTPYPHRAKNIFMIYKGVYWDGKREGAKSLRHLNWMRDMHSYMGKYVSRSPRRAYINYRDLDLGVNNVTGNTSYEEASIWGVQYYKNNFKRLAEVKSMIDPGNFFTDEQSIPPLPTLLKI